MQMAFKMLPKMSVFLSVIGPTTYKLLASLIAPDKLGDKDYKELVKFSKSIITLHCWISFRDINKFHT